MAAVSRLGLYGGSRSPYGSFAGKTAYAPPASKPYTKTFTRLGLYGSTRTPYGAFAGKTETIVVPSKAGGHIGRKRRRYVVEVDGQYIEVANISEAEHVLRQVRELAQEAAESTVTTPVTPKPPRIKVRTGAGKPTTSKVIQREVRRTQKAVNRAYIQAAERIKRDLSITQEIAALMQTKLREEDEEDSIITLLLIG